MRISVICIFNNEEQLNNMLLHSYRKVVVGNGVEDNISLILINNVSNRYKSAADAYNTEIKNHFSELGDILVFLHQDIAFDNDDFWKRLVNEFSKRKNLIIGAAGIADDGIVYSNLKYLDNGEYITEHQLDGIKEVESLDECCFAIDKGLFSKVMFDANTCSHWHLYAVDLCYTCKKLFNTTVAVIPEELYHKEKKGGLNVDKYFIKSMWKVVRKHSDRFPFIYSTCYQMSTKGLLPKLRLLRAYFALS